MTGKNSGAEGTGTILCWNKSPWKGNVNDIVTIEVSIFQSNNCRPLKLLNAFNPYHRTCARIVLNCFTNANYCNQHLVF